MGKTALILVDIQRGFCPGGNLAVGEGDRIVPVANRLIAKAVAAGQIVVATQDWHPANHGSFASQNEGAAPFTLGKLDGLDQMFWPDHCVQGSVDAEFHPDLNMSPVAAIFRKGMDPKVDSYSGFFDNAKRNDTGLAAYLKGRGVTDVVVIGLATDYCVKYTALDAKALGFNVTVVPEACRAVGGQAASDATLTELTDAKIEVSGFTE